MRTGPDGKGASMVPIQLVVRVHLSRRSFMSGQAEHTFVKAFVNILASQPVTFDDDFQEQPEKTLKRVPVVQVRAIDPANTSPNNPTTTARCAPASRVEEG